MSDNELSKNDIDALFNAPGKAPNGSPANEPPPTGSPDTARPSAPTGTAVQVRSATVEKEPVDAQPAQFSQLAAHGEPAEGRKIDFLLDIPVSITVELGRTSMVIRDALNLGSGSVVELEKLAGEPVDLLINNKLVARGEVVVVNENFGVKVIDIVSPEERLRYLR